jgi:membrane-associated protease RseP (regulator of RpoE activity)
MTLLTLNDQLGAFFKAPENRGVLVEEVREGSEAARAGLRAGDVIVKAGRRTVEEVYDVQRAVSRADNGEKLAFEIIRNGSKQTLTVTVPEATEEGLGNMYWFEHHPDDGGAFELDLGMPELRKDMDHLRLELRKLEGLDNDLRREMERGEGTRHRILRKTRPGGDSVRL